jgi:hypothetical protein
MKKTSALLVGIAFCLQAIAQNNKVTSAKMHLTDYMEHRDSNELNAAKESIDEAAVNDKTKDEPKMYLYRGEVYLMYFNIKLGILATKLIPAGSANDVKAVAKATAQAYSKIDTNAICIAANSFIKVLQLAPKDYYSEEAKQQQNLPVCLIHVGNKALQEFNEQRYASSLAMYQKAILLCNILSISDTNYKEDISMAATSAAKAGNTAMALCY